MSFNLKREQLKLYAVTDRRWLKEEESISSKVEEAILGGATFVQLREKKLPYDEFLKEAVEVKKICRTYGVPFVINDNVEISMECGADGIHVGQKDMAAGHVREIIGPDMILGVSAQTVEQALEAERKGADYIGAGAVFHTGSKDDAIEVGPDVLAEICKAVKIPVVAIGGISGDNIELLKNTGIAGVAVISALFAENDAKKAAENLIEKLNRTV